jgi:PAS domain S-box-containing protein
VNSPAPSKRHIRLSAGLLSAAFLGMAAMAAWNYFRQRNALDAAARSELAAICEAKTIQLDNWRRERTSDGQFLAWLLEAGGAGRLLADPEAPLRTEVMGAMRALQESFGYRDATLVDTEGNVVLRLESDRTDQARITKRQRGELARQALAAKAPVLSDITLENREQTPLMTLTIPIATAGGLILEIDPALFLYPYLRTWPTARRTGETILARRDGRELVYLSELRMAAGAPGFARRSITGIEIPAPAELVKGAPLIGKDYRGERVLGHVRSVPDSNWLLIAKLDAAEVHGSTQRLAWELAVILALIGLANGTGILLIRKSHELRMHHESEERFRAIANETPALLWMAAPDGRSLFINRRLSVFLGVEGPLSMIRWTDFLHPEDAARAKEEADRRFAGRARFSYEVRFRRADGEYRWVLSEGMPRTGADGEFLGYAGSLLDITDRKIAEQKLHQSNAMLTEELIEKTQREAEIRGLSARLIHAQEEERRRLSRELHDDLSQQIAALSIGMGNLKRGIAPEQAEAREQSDRLQQRLVGLSEAVRRMSHELHPAILQHSGLGAALRGYCREFGEVSGIRVKLRTVGEFAAAPPEVALSVFRIVQEALRNVAKHAGVNEAEVELIHTGEAIRLTVSDAGVGFAAGEQRRPAGLGLVSIRERTRLVEGTVELESAPGAGTRLTVRIPDRDGASAAIV